MSIRDVAELHVCAHRPHGGHSWKAGLWARLKFFDTFSYRMRANSHYFSNFAVTDAVGLQMFGFRPDEVPSVPLVQACHKSQITLRQHFWRCFLYHIMSFGITHKVTKNPLDSKIYLINIQHIKQLFCRKILMVEKVSFPMIGIMPDSYPTVA